MTQPGQLIDMKRQAKNLTKSALADSLGISRQALNVHLKKPDAPKIADLAGWQIYLAANGRIGTSDGKYRLNGWRFCGPTEKSWNATTKSLLVR